MEQCFGVCPAIVVDNVDPESIGRVKVHLPHASAPGKDGYEAWARIATLMAGANRGTWFIPDVKDEVLVAFEEGDLRRPYVIGGLWSGANRPPETMDGDNNTKQIRSRNGVTITLADHGGQERVTIETPGGQRLTLKDGPGAVEIIDSNGNAVELKASGITVNAASKVALNASTVELNAGVLTVNAGMSRFSGVVRCDTLISNSVVSETYTPGAGNLL